MARPFAYNPSGNPPPGCTQYGSICIGTNDIDYSTLSGGLTWWYGPDEDPGYVIAIPAPSGNVTTPLGITASISFNRTVGTSSTVFANMVNGISGKSYNNASSAALWLVNNGYWTSYILTNPVFNEFIIEVDTTKAGSASDTIQLPIKGTNMTIDWGDGNISTGVTKSTASTSDPVSHTYSSSGTYTIKVSSAITQISFNYGSGDCQKLIKVKNWGWATWSSFISAFGGCNNMTLSAQDAPNLTSVTSMSYMFYNCSLFNTDINSWDVSNVTDMSSMFYGAINFNQNIGSWNVSKVIYINGMFNQAQKFNKDISSWNVSNVTNMQGMFGNAFDFNQNIGGWNVASVTNMSYLFNGATSFNQNIGSWNVSKVTDMSAMFSISFNQDISSWNVSNVTNMQGMFNVAFSFNQNIGSWNVSKVTDMSYMFQYAYAFNQNIGGWNISNVNNFISFMSYKTPSNFSASNLDAIYNGWSAISVKPNKTIDFGTIKYTAAGQAGRNILTGAPNNWSITDGGI